MKKIIAILALFAAMAANAQEQQATITYSLKMENSPAAAVMGDLHVTIYYKQGKSLAEIGSSLFSTKTLVTDSGSLTLMDVMGQKYYSKTAAVPKDSSNNITPDITYVDSTKEIAGYTCKKAIVKIKGLNGLDTAVFWYTEKLPVVSFGQAAKLYRGLRGMPLEYAVNTSAIKLSVKAEKVSTGPVADTVFQLSIEGYNELPVGSMLDQFKQ